MFTLLSFIFCADLQRSKGFCLTLTVSCMCAVLFCADGSVLHTFVQLHDRPHEIYRQVLHKQDQMDLRGCILEYAKCAETLTVAASLKNANQILLDDSVIHELQKSIRQLTFKSFSDRQSISVMQKVARNLVGDGAVDDLSILSCSLSSSILSELLEFGAVAGSSSEAKCHVSDSWTQDGSDAFVVDNQVNMSDLYDIALQPCGANHCHFSSVSCRSCSRRFSLSERAGVRALKLLFVNSASGSFDTVLADVLPRWQQLEKIAFIKYTDMESSPLAKTLHYLCTQIECGQLTHVIFETCNLPSDFLSLLLSALFRRCRCVLMSAKFSEIAVLKVIR